MNKKFLILFFLLAGLLLPSCSYDEPDNLYESKLEQKDGKIILKFSIPFIIEKIQSGELANKWGERSLISLDKSVLMKVRAKFTPKGDNKTDVEMEFPADKMDINGKYVLCITKNQVSNSTGTTKNSDNGSSGTERYVIEIDENSVVAVSKASNMTGFAYGDGSEENPYQIFGADDFYMLIYNLYKDDTDAAGIYFKQTGDFSWTDVEEKSISTGMNKIESFAGIYDGNGCTVSDMSYHGSNSSNYTNIGLFSELKNGAEVKNLNFNNISFINVFKDCGAVAGSAVGDITIDNITISGTMSFENMGDNIGGILGSHRNGILKISNITNNLSINGANNNVSGVVGYIEDATFEFNNFDAATTQFSVNAYCYIGSVVGRIYNSSYVINDVYVNHIIPEQDKDVLIISGTGSGIGGVIGYVDQCTESSLSNITIRTSVGSTCISVDNVSGTNMYEGSGIGGLIGLSDTNGSTTMSDVKVSGHIKGYIHVGGFVGGVQTYSQSNTSLIFKGNNSIQPEQSSYVAVTGFWDTGGLIGNLTSTTLTLEKPVVITTNVNCQYDRSGGFCGYILKSVCNLTNLQFSETMTVSSNQNSAGGVAGEISQSDVTGPIMIDFTYGHQSALPDFNNFTPLYKGKVVGKNYAGGFAGFIDASNVTGFAVKANVTGSSEIGGFAGAIRFTNSNNHVSGNAFYGNVTGTGENIGGIVGTLKTAGDKGSFTTKGFYNNIAYGSVNGGGNVSGVVGNLDVYKSNIILHYCVNAAQVAGSGQVGGVVANVDEDHNAPTIEFCANFGNISATTDKEEVHNVGGVVGYAKLRPVYIYNCTNHGNITASGPYKGIGGVAGEVGYNTGTVKCKDNAYVKYCANFGNISGNHEQNYVGGVVGFLQEGAGDKGNCCLYDSYNRGEILSKHKRDTGGILGQADHYDTVCRNINFGKVHYGNAIIGYRKNGTAIIYVGDNYFLEGSGKDWKATDSFTDSEKGDTASYSGFDFSSVWEMVDGYPYLRQNPFQRTVFDN